MPETGIPKILIIGNELIIAADLSVQLYKLGYEVSGIHRRAVEALKTIEEHRPDVVVMDIGLPGSRDNIAAAEVISGRYCIPIIFLSPYSTIDTLLAAMGDRAYALISKPFEIKDLHRAVEYILHPSEASIIDEGHQAIRRLFCCGKVYALPIPSPLDH